MGAIIGQNHSGGWTIRGEGQGTSILFSPKGIRGAAITPQAFPNMMICDFTLSGNAGLEGFGLGWYTTLETIPAARPPRNMMPTGLSLSIEGWVQLPRPHSMRRGSPPG